jgi:hypothetical protein
MPPGNQFEFVFSQPRAGASNLSQLDGLEAPFVGLSSLEPEPRISTGNTPALEPLAIQILQIIDPPWSICEFIKANKTNYS